MSAVKTFLQKWLARSTVFAAFFAVTSFWLAQHNLLTGQYIAAIGAVHSFIVIRAIAEDHHERELAKTNGNAGASQEVPPTPQG